MRRFHVARILAFQKWVGWNLNEVLPLMLLGCILEYDVKTLSIQRHVILKNSRVVSEYPYVSNKPSAKDMKIKLNKRDLHIRHYRRGQVSFAMCTDLWRNVNKGKVSWAVALTFWCSPHSVSQSALCFAVPFLLL